MPALVLEVKVNVTVVVLAAQASDFASPLSMLANTKSGVDPNPCVTADVVAAVVDDAVTVPAVSLVGPSAIRPASVAAACSSAV